MASAEKSTRLYRSGVAAYHAGRVDEAVRSLRRAIDLEPDYGPAWNNLGNALEEQSELVGAALAYSRAIAAEPHRPTYLLSRASVLVRLGETMDAVGDLEHALRVAPEIRRLLPGFREFAALLKDPRLRRKPD